MTNDLSRRQCLAAGTIAALGATTTAAAEKKPDQFRLRYILASAMYGYAPLKEILPEVKKVGADAIDIWPKVHGDQREQIETPGPPSFAAIPQLARSPSRRT